MIYFVRHGATDWNENKNTQGQKDPKCQGRADLDLNEKGVEQAKQTAEKLKGIKFDRVICSPLKRAKQTLDIIYTGETPVELDERVIERAQVLFAENEKMCFHVIDVESEDFISKLKSAMQENGIDKIDLIYFFSQSREFCFDFIIYSPHYIRWSSYSISIKHRHD